jgi:tRNA (cytidine32/guanosine34-2'-O)-methyltransferase
MREGRAKVVSLDLQPMVSARGLRHIMLGPLHLVLTPPPQAPLKNITILQTDITLPSTIPLVLNALGGRKADLVVCDGAPDGRLDPLCDMVRLPADQLVTGVHDLDAYLHSQLLLAVSPKPDCNTGAPRFHALAQPRADSGQALTLSLTLLAPHATLIFKIFLSPLDPQADMLRSQVAPFFQAPEAGSAGDYDASANGEDAWRGKTGYDLRGRRGGVWVRKPRSSRPGSSGA